MSAGARLPTIDTPRSRVEDDHRIASSLRLKVTLIAFMTALLLGVTALMFALVTRIFDHMTPAVHADLGWKAERGAAELAESMQVGLLLGDRSMLEKAAQRYVTDPDVEALVAADAEGRVAFSSGTLRSSGVFDGAAEAIHEDSDRMVAWRPSVIEGSTVGKVALVVSLERVKAGLRLRRTILLVAGFGLPPRAADERILREFLPGSPSSRDRRRISARSSRRPSWRSSPTDSRANFSPT